MAIELTKEQTLYRMDNPIPESEKKPSRSVCPECGNEFDQNPFTYRPMIYCGSDCRIKFNARKQGDKRRREKGNTKPVETSGMTELISELLVIHGAITVNGLTIRIENE